MKEWLILLSFTLASLPLFAQGNDTIAPPNDGDTMQILVNPDTPPVFSEGIDSLMRFLSNNIRISSKAGKSCPSGKVVIQFTVSETGKVENPVILKSLCKELDKEALRVVSIMPDWIPGRQHGKLVSVKYVFPINFKLED